MRRLKYLVFLLLPLLHSCSPGSGQAQIPVDAPIEKLSDRLIAEVLIEGLKRPWGMAWISPQKLLITERGGSVKLADLSTKEAQELAGVAPVFSSGQGGLLDVALHPSFSENSLVYFSYSSGSSNQNKTAVARAKLNQDSLSDWQVIFEVSDKKSGSQHFGSRLLWLPDQTLLVSIGDGGNPPLTLNGQLIREQAQNLQSHLGKVIRINDDGSIPDDNPYPSDKSLPELWSVGHRNIQGMAIDPKTQTVWSTEHGARGGDELNLMSPGQNYGWPKASFSLEYTQNKAVAPVTSLPGTVAPKWVWTPSIAPSGLAIYRGDRYPDWDGNLLAGALRNQSIVRLAVDDAGKTTQIEEIPVGQRVRDVGQGLDGWVYVLTDSQDGRLLRLQPNQVQ